MAWRFFIRFLIVAALAGVANFSALSAPADSAYAEAAALSGKDPAEYYQRVNALFQGGRKDDAVFLFYLGQLRYWTYLRARPSEGDPALLSSITDVVGRPLNEYAFGDIPAFVSTIDAVVAYEEANPDKRTPPSDYPQAHAQVKESLLALKQTLLADADRIRAGRQKHGLENRN